MNSNVNKYGNAHLFNSTSLKEISLWYIAVLVIAVYALQRGIIGLRNWIALELSLIHI